MTDVKPEELKSLAAKLAAACNAVGGVEKKGRNIQQSYDYVKAADVAKAIRHELFERGIVILPNEGKPEWREYQTMKGSTMRECTLEIAYHITDGTETLVMSAYGVAADSGDKAIYKAKTGALKYFLRGLGLIPDEKDDPENDKEDKTQGEATKEQEKITQYEQAFYDRDAYIAPPVQEGIRAFAKANGKTEEQLATWLKVKLNVTKIDQVKKADLEALKAYIMGKEPLQDTLSASVKASTSDSLPFDDGKGAVKVTEPQIKRLYAIATSCHVPREDVGRYVSEEYGLESTKDLNRAQYDHVVNWIQAQGAPAKVS